MAQRPTPTVKDSDWITVDDGDWQTVAHPDLSPTLLASRQAASKSEFEANRPESTIGTRAREVAIGGLEPFTASAMVDTGKEVAGSLWDVIRGKGSARAQELVKGLVTAPLRPVQAFAEGIRAGDYDKAAYGAGGMLTQTVPAVSAIAPKIPRAIRAVLPAEDVLMGGAATARNAVAKLQPGIPLSKTDLAIQAAKASMRPLVNTGARTAEEIAKWKAGKPTDLAGAAIDEAMRPKPGLFRQIQSKSNPRMVAADEASRIAQAPILPREIPDASIGATRPVVPQFIENQLEATRQAETPQQVFDRMRAQQNAEIPVAETETTAAAVRPQPETITPEKLSVWDQIRGRYGAALPPKPDAPAVNRWMKVSPNDVMHGANPGEQLLRENLIGESRTATKANVDAALKDAGQQLEAHLKAADGTGVTFDAQTPVYDRLTAVESKLTSPTDAAFKNRINEILDKVETRYPDLGKLSPSQVQSLKIELGDAFEQKGLAGSEPATVAMKQIYRDLNKLLKGIEGTEALQDRWANLYVGSKSLRRSIAGEVAGQPGKPLSGR